MKDIYGISAQNVYYRLILKSRVSILEGDSGTGKTYLYNTIKYSLKNPLSLNKNQLSDIVTINIWEDFSDSEEDIVLLRLKNIKEKLIIIDRADLGLRDKDKLIDFINKDFNNKYLLIGRVDVGINFSFKDVLHFEEFIDNDMRTLITVPKKCFRKHGDIYDYNNRR